MQTDRYSCSSGPAEIVAQEYHTEKACVWALEGTLSVTPVCSFNTSHLNMLFPWGKKRNVLVVMEIYCHFSFSLSIERVWVQREGCRNEMWAGWHGAMTAGSRWYWSVICHGSPLLKKRTKVFHNMYLIFHFQLLFCYAGAPWARLRIWLHATVKTEELETSEIYGNQ